MSTARNDLIKIPVMALFVSVMNKMLYGVAIDGYYFLLMEKCTCNWQFYLFVKV